MLHMHVYPIHMLIYIRATSVLHAHNVGCCESYIICAEMTFGVDGMPAKRSDMIERMTVPRNWWNGRHARQTAWMGLIDVLGLRMTRRRRKVEEEKADVHLQGTQSWNTVYCGRLTVAQEWTVNIIIYINLCILWNSNVIWCGLCSRRARVCVECAQCLANFFSGRLLFRLANRCIIWFELCDLLLFISAIVGAWNTRGMNAANMNNAFHIVAVSKSISSC